MEKVESPPPVGDGSVVEVEVEVEKDWTDEEEKRAKRKLDRAIMPLLALGYFCLQLDKGNIANALTDNFKEDIGLSQHQFNVGQQLMALGIVIFEFPSNMILYRVGPGKWLTLQLFLLAFQTNYASFLATRFLLGLTEAGFGPGGLWTIGTWYTRKETAKRVMLMYFGIQFGSATSKLIAYGILHMRGVAGRSGWFWLFVLMGSFTCLCGVLLGSFLPDSVQKPRSTFFPRQIFSDRELYILKARVLRDDPMKAKKKKSIGLCAFKKLFTDWRMWVHFMIALCNSGPVRAFDTYAPSIVKGLGFSALQSNALASVGLFLQIPVAFGFSWVSDRYSRRAETVIAGLTLHMTGYILNRGFTELGHRNVSYFGVIFTQMFGTLPQPLNVAWMSLTCVDPEQRAPAMAFCIMGANIAGIYGAQLFRADDSPLYRRGFSLAIGLSGLGIFIATFRYLADRRRQRREASTSSSMSNNGSDETLQGLQNVSIDPSSLGKGEDVQTVVGHRDSALSQDLKSGKVQ